MAIKTRGFFYIQQVEQLVQQCLEEVLQPNGLTAGQYLVMSLVAHYEPLSSAELSRLARKTAQSMGEFVKSLEYKGLLERRDDPSNRRVLLISTTAQGRSVLLRCEVAVDHAERNFFSCLQPEELAILRHALGRIRNAAHQRQQQES
jgi:DNA-binding MarR family transcriptional regulator